MVALRDRSVRRATSPPCALLVTALPAAESVACAVAGVPSHRWSGISGSAARLGLMPFTTEITPMKRIGVLVLLGVGFVGTLVPVACGDSNPGEGSTRSDGGATHSSGASNHGGNTGGNTG